MNKLFFLATLSVLLNAHDLSAQTGVEQIPTIDQEWNKSPTNLSVSFANSNIRYPLDQAPELKAQQTWKASAWRGEKVHTQLLVWSKNDVDKIRLKITDLKSNNGGKISKDQISTGFIGYVMTDEYKDGCGYRKSVDFDSSLVPDPPRLFKA